MTDYTPTKLMLPTSHYDSKRADYAVKFISMLKFTKGEWAGKKFELQLWQEQIVRDLFGVVNEEGIRQFRVAYIEIPKKQGKSELAAAIALYLLVADGEPGAEVYSCAADRDQASIVYNTAKSMVEQCQGLREITKVIDSTKRIIFPKTNSFYRVLSSEVKTKQGYNVSGLVFDELFAQSDRELFDTLTKYTGDARRQPLFFLITTAGRDKNSICYEQHIKAKGILDGTRIDPQYYPVIFGIDENDDWTSPEVWRKCNPSIGVTVKYDVIEAAFKEAEQNPAEELHFRQFRLNEWTNADIRWMPSDKWNACGEDFEIDELEGQDCYAGLDLSQSYDLTSLVLVFPPMGGDKKYTVVPYFWIPEEAIWERSKRDHVPYQTWQKSNVIMTTPGNVVDYDYITGHIKKLAEKFRIREIAYDRWGAEKIRRDLQEIGDDMGFEVFPFGQGFASMSPPTKDLYQLVMESKIKHDNHPVLNWNIANAVAETDAAGNIKLSKKKSTERIDGAIAMIMGLARATIHKAEPQFFEYDGMKFI